MKNIINTSIMILFSGIILGQSNLTGAWIPLGSTEVNGVVNPPSGWTYAGINLAGVFQTVTGGISISCTCSSGSGKCFPFVLGSWRGCATDGTCKTCIMGNALKTSSGNVGFTSGGYINMSLGIKFKADNAELPGGFGAMLQNTEVQKGITDFVNSIYKGIKPPSPIVGSDGGLTAPNGYVFTLITAYGRGFTLLVPAKTPGVVFSMSSHKCDCSAGGCSPASKMGILYCEGNCTGTCTLRTASNWPKINTYTY